MVNNLLKDDETNRERDLERAEMLLQKVTSNVEIEVFDESTVVALKETMTLFEKWEVEEKMAEVYLSWGKYQTYVENWSEASRFFDKSLKLRKSLFGEKHEAVAEVYRSLSDYYIETGQLELAEKQAKKALTINLDLFGEKHLDTAKSYFLLGIAINAKRFEMNLEYSNKALAIAQEFPDCPLILFGNIYAEMAIVFYELSNYPQSKFFSKKGLVIYQQLLPPTHKRFGNVYYHLSLVFKREANYKKALFYLQKTNTIFQINTPNSLYTAYVCHEMANLYLNFFNYSKVIEKEEEALGILDGLKINSHQLSIYCLLNIANAYKGLEQISECFKVLNKTLKLTNTIGGEGHHLLSPIYRELAVCYSKMNDLPTSLKYFEQSLEILQNHKNNQLLDFMAIWRDMSCVFLDHKQFIPALEYCQKVLSSILGCPDVTDYYQTIPFIDNPYDYTPPVDKILFLGTLCLKGYIFLHYYLHESNDLRELKAAFEAYEVVWKYGDVIRNSLELQDSKLLIARNIEDEVPSILAVAHHLYITTSRTVYLNRIFDSIEKSKAYLLLEHEQEKTAKQESVLPPTLLKLENELREKIIALEKKIQSEKQQKENLFLLQEYQNEHFQTYHQFETLRKQLEEEYPEYYRLKYNTSVVAVEGVQNILTKYQIILNYFIGEEKIYLFVISIDEYELFVMDKPSNWIELVEAYLQSIKLHQKAEFHQLSFELYQILLQEAIHHIINSFEEEAKQVFIIPHAELHYLPFETLIIQDAGISKPYQELDYLLNYCQISYHYSATLLHLDLQKQSMQAERVPTEMTFTGFAPIYKATSTDQQKALEALQNEPNAAVNRSEAVRSNGTWMPLPYSKLEVENISELFEKQGYKSQSFLYETATKSNLEEQIGNSRFVLIAAHGIVNDEYPELSGLVLASDGDTLVTNERKENSPLFEKHNDIWNDDENEQRSSEQTVIEDCILNMKEVAMIPMSADLVVLSSCESGIGELHKGEGMIAVNRGFLASGAKNVVSTLFKVNDRASSELTTLMFGYILKGENFATALQKAKLELLMKRGMSPKAWSGFVLFGAGK